MTEPTQFDTALARKLFPLWSHPLHNAQYRDALKAIAEHTALARSLTETERRKAKAFDTIRDLMGHTQDGSSEVVTIFQDDATGMYFVKVGQGQRASDAYAGTFLDAVEAWEKIPH